MPDQPMSRFMTVRQVREEYGIPDSTQRQWRNEGRFVPSYPAGNRIAYRRELVEKWVQQHEQGCAIPPVVSGVDATPQDPAMRQLPHILVQGTRAIGAVTYQLSEMVDTCLPIAPEDLRAIHQELNDGWEHLYDRIHHLLNPHLDGDYDEGVNVDAQGDVATGNQASGVRLDESGRKAIVSSAARRPKVTDQPRTDWEPFDAISNGGVHQRVSCDTQSGRRSTPTTTTPSADLSAQAQVSTAQTPMFAAQVPTLSCAQSD